MQDQVYPLSTNPSQPMQEYSQPLQGYGQPLPGYSPLPQGYAPPLQGYAQSLPHGQPQQSYQSPHGYSQIPPGYGQKMTAEYAPPNYVPGQAVPQPYGQFAPNGRPVATAYPPPPQHGGYVQSPAQEQQHQWMPLPVAKPDCPRGLEYLTQVDQLLVHQQVELLEAFTGFETSNRYEIKNSLGQKVYFAAEDNDCCTRQCCGPCRQFDMKILDNAQQEVIHLERPLRCSSCWWPCCLQQMTVSSPPGSVIGSIEQTWHMCLPKFDVLDQDRTCILKIVGPCCTCNGCGDVEFKVLDRDSEVEIGMISKQWTGLVKEYFTDADNFGIQFPMDLDVKAKALLLAAVFLIDFMFFEQTESHDDEQQLGVWHT